MNKVYETPDSVLQDSGAEERVLASRWARLGGSIIDSLVLMIAFIPVALYLGVFDEANLGKEPGFLQSLMMSVSMIVFFFIVNTKFLMSDGQTIGKKIVGTRIVPMDDSELSFTRHILARYAVFFLPGQIPVIGQLFSIVNVLFVFRSDKRCIHDLVGNTQVIKN